MKKLLWAFLCMAALAIPVMAEEGSSEANLYAQAVALEKAEDYSGAISCYTELGDFLDSRERYVQLLPHMAHQVRAYDEGVAAFEAGGKWGLINSKGVVILPPTWNGIDEFCEGRALVLRRDQQFRRYYDIIDTQGQVIWKSDWSIESYSDWSDVAYYRFCECGLAAICRKGEWGFINRDGKIVIEPKYYDPYSTDALALRDPFESGAEWLLEGRIVSGKPHTCEGIWRYIDTEGNVLLENRYQDVGPFSEGLAAVKADGKYGFIDETGNMVIAPRWDWTLPFDKGISIVWDGEKQGAIDRLGHIVIEPIWDDIQMGPDGKYFVVFAGEWDEWGEDFGTGLFGFYDTTGNTIWEPQWDRMHSGWGMLDLYGERIPVEKDGKWGALNQDLELAIPVEWDSLYFYEKGENVGWGERDGKEYYIDVSGSILFEYVWEKHGYHSIGEPFICGLALVHSGSEWGYVNLAGKMVIRGWDTAEDFTEGGTAVVGRYSLDENGDSLYREYVIDTDGTIVSDHEWLDIINFDDTYNRYNETFGLAMAQAPDGKWGFIERATGKTRITPIWDEVNHFSEGLAFVKNDGYWHLIDLDGNTVY